MIILLEGRVFFVGILSSYSKIYRISVQAIYIGQYAEHSHEHLGGKAYKTQKVKTQKSKHKKLKQKNQNTKAKKTTRSRLRTRTTRLRKNNNNNNSPGPPPLWKDHLLEGRFSVIRSEQMTCKKGARGNQGSSRVGQP